MSSDINLWAVLACGVASMVTGFLWYGPLFSKAWLKEMGWDPNNAELMEKMKKSASAAYPQQFVGALIMAYVFAVVLINFETDSIGMALQGAFWTWLGFIAVVKYGETLWGSFSKKLFLIDSLYYLLNLAVFAIILVSWK